MDVVINKHNEMKFAFIEFDDIVINNTQDAFDLMGNAGYQGASCIILREQNINPQFFDLKTGLAGDILQKFSNYQTRLAIIGDFTKYQSKSLSDFIRESNKYGHINFVSSNEEALNALSR
jgi:hypothetical protein